MQTLLFAIMVAASGFGWLRLDFPESQLRPQPSACPIRIELPLDGFFAGRKTSYSTKRVASANCQAIKITRLQMKRVAPAPGEGKRPVPGTEDRLMIDAEVWVPKGRDRELQLRYELLDGSEEVGIAEKAMHGDEGELNWEDPVELYYGKAPAAGLLRIEVTVEYSE